MSAISARFHVAYTNFTLDVNLDLPAHGITALFGPSGSGKTTLLRCMAGLEPNIGGHFSINGDTWQDGETFVPTHQRSLGYVFQEANLFTHLKVKGNLEYGMKRVPLNARKIQMEQVVELLSLQALLNRGTENLSGGERQRVAMGRALLTSPTLLLMDEPLAALDAASKQEILPYLERLHTELSLPIIYVSHALDEVARLANHLVLLERGRVVASGPLNETLARLDLPTAHLDNTATVIEASVAAHDDAYHLTRLDFTGGNLWVTSLANEIDRAIGSIVRIRVQARDVSIATSAPHGSSISNILTARITDIQPEGQDRVNIQLNVGGAQVLLSRITRRSSDQLGLVIGMEVFAQVKSVVLIA